MDNFVIFSILISSLLTIYILLCIYVHFCNVEFKNDIYLFKNKYSINISRHSSFSYIKIGKQLINDSFKNVEAIDSNKIDTPINVNKTAIYNTFNNKENNYQDNDTLIITIDNDTVMTQKEMDISDSTINTIFDDFILQPEKLKHSQLLPSQQQLEQEQHQGLEIRPQM